ncbi:helix-turn-helix domain-containing protein [Mesorhizobium sp. IMUNJ 23232]|uniref:helix-turn-helix domain-containing protein n=1 Tax=Mesorhizobium sp. IMUNJ 23232 TaxID=3376064 RepID=UPI0037A47A9B
MQTVINSNYPRSNAAAATLQGASNRQQRPEVAKPLSQLRAGNSLFFEGDDGDNVYHLVKGTVAFYRFMSDEHRVICGFALAGEVFNMSHRGRYLCSAEALSDCLFRQRSRKDIEANQVHDQMHERYVACLESEPWTVQFQTLRRLHLMADERAANFILEMGRRTNPALTNGSRVRLEMSRADIASYLGLTVETVVRSLKRLVSMGLLVAYTPHEFGICDIAGIQRRLAASRDRSGSLAYQ